MGELTGEWQNGDLDAYLQRLKAKLHGIMIQRNRSWNHARPLYRLPTEILVNILSLVEKIDIHNHHYIKSLRKLASVSHQWLLIVKGTPSFWKVASSNLPPKLLKQVFSRSMGHLLEVFEDGYNSLDSLFFHFAITHVHRWRSLVVEEGSYRGGLSKWSQWFIDAPALEVLTLRGSSYRALHVPNKKLGSLRCVRLLMVCIPWESKMMSDLEELELVDPGPDGPSKAELLAILAASPRLINFTLAGFKQPQDSSHTTPQMISVELPMLEKLSIRKNSQELTHYLLAATHTPRCTSFFIDYRQKTTSDFSLFNDPALAHTTSILVASLRTSPSIEIGWRYGYEDQVIRTSSSLDPVHINSYCIQGDWHAVLPGGLLSALEVAGSSEIHLYFSCSNPPSIILPLLSSLQCRVTKIRMDRTESCEATDLIRFLAKPIMVDGISQWSLPRLVELIIGCSNIG
ncbi:hypothetical protein FRB95_013129 [Tulasnella sp. JGI-2019a]|nr:hypothetical protein FRB95_013129 [Tulasnella sp. JGI-2019a]